MSEEVKLLPCPFCGGQPKGLVDLSAKETVQCLECRVLFPFNVDKSVPLRNWNTRAQSPREKKMWELLESAEVYLDSKYGYSDWYKDLEELKK